GPRATSRGATVAQLETVRDVRIPALLYELTDLNGRLEQFAQESDDNRRASEEVRARTQNELKYQLNVQARLADPAMWAAKRAQEAELRKGRADSETDPWRRLETVQVTYRSDFRRWRLLEANPGSGSALLHDAILLVRAASE